MTMFFWLEILEDDKQNGRESLIDAAMHAAGQQTQNCLMQLTTIKSSHHDSMQRFQAYGLSVISQSYNANGLTPTWTKAVMMINVRVCELQF